MADKEQTNDSLKNSDKNFNENCTHNKEQLMIDGVNVDGCKYLNTFSDCDGYHYYCDLADDIKNEYCEYYKDCYFKQLARKTQECEELKERLVRTEEDLKYQCVDCMNVKSGRYRKALEEIEEYINSQGINHKWNMYIQRFRSGILDIINKAKDGE